MENVLSTPLMLAEESTTRPPQRPMDESKFDAFYRKTAASLWTYLHRLTGDAAAADDLLQKAFFRFLRNNPVVTSEEHMRRWIYRTATNLTFDHFREAKRDRFAQTVAQPRAATSTLDLRHDMARLFAELKPQERALLWLAHVEESNHSEIGEALGVKTKSVKVLLFRARKRLAELLKRSGIGPEALR
ncbi:MAG TPA: RNA polymerase sigma factor [Thermoanaerobaculia bacterium]|nr:RNA polymerase sigma factor [Thermoanaerobaculia bacterium]